MIRILFISLFIWGFTPGKVFSQEGNPLVKKKVKVKYRSRTNFDFSGNRIRGKIKSPAVFYIFQRKRTDEHKAIKVPENFDEHKMETKRILTSVVKGSSKQ